MKKICNKCGKIKTGKHFYLGKSTCNKCRIAMQKILNAKYKQQQKLPFEVLEYLRVYSTDKMPTKTQLKDFCDNR